MSGAVAERLVAEFLRAGTARGRSTAGAFQIEGIRLFERALAAGRPPSLAIASSGLSSAGPRQAALLASLRATPGCQLVEVAPPRLRDLVDGRTFGDLVGLVPAWRPPELALTLADADRLLVGCDIQNPGNAGALIRTALATGACGYVALGGTDPFHPKAVRASMGAIFKLPVWRDLDAEALARACTSTGVSLVGLVTRGEQPLWRTRAAHPRAALVVGSEAFGLAEAGARRLDVRTSIPMPRGVDSLSVAVAAAMALYEWTRPEGGGSLSPSD